MTWHYDSDIITEKPAGYIGFIYLITNTRNGRLYLGQKVFDTLKAPTKTATPRTKRVRKETWLDYYGSSADLKADIKRYGKDAFRREILQLCESKSEMNYFEAKYIFEADAVLDPKYYNKWVACKVSANQIPKMITQWIKKNV